LHHAYRLPQRGSGYLAISAPSQVPLLPSGEQDFVSKNDQVGKADQK
jgi:hypothetical protein